MKKIFKVLFFIITVSFSNTVFANICEENIIIDNKCTSDSCYSTESSYVWFNDDFFILDNTEIKEINNFKTWLNLELKNNIIDNFNTWSFLIEDFCTVTGSGSNFIKDSCEDKNINLEYLINYDDKIIIDKWFFGTDEFYSNWKHYFFTHFNSLLTKVKWSSVNLSLSDIVLNLSNFDNIYNKNKFSIKNICTNSTCTESDYLSFYWVDENNYKILKWGKVSKKWEDYSIFDFKHVTIPYSTSKIKLWELVLINFKFINNIPNINCVESQFNYSIKYTYLMENGDESWLIDTWLEWIIKVNINGTNLTTGNWGIEYTKIENDELEVSIKENINTSKVWKIFFYIKVIRDWGKEIYKKINTYPIEVVSGDPINYNSEIEFTDLDSTQFYYKDDIFTSRVYLKDIWNNTYKDTLYWIKVSHSSSNLVFEWSTDNVIDNIKSNVDSDWNNYFEFRYSFKAHWNYEKKFWLVIPKVDIDWNKTINNISFNIWNPLEKINIRNIIVSEIKNLRCSQVIIVEAICTWDDFSWCDGYSSDKKTFDSETDNWQSFTLTAQDNAGNKFNYNWDIDHIDRTPPTVEFIDLDFSSSKSNEDTEFKFNISDINPGWCRDISKVKYKIFVNKDDSWYWVAIVDKEIDNIEIKTVEVEIPELKYIFKESGNYKIKIITEDAVWNIDNTSYIIEFNIFPSTEIWIGSIYSNIVADSNWNKYANNVDEYNYVLELKDKYWNPIYWKEILYIKQNCGYLTWCKVLKQNEVDNSSEDVLNINYPWTTDSDWKINIKIKSLSPWEFSGYFEIKLEKWWDNYNSNTWMFNSINLWSVLDKNEFKKPVTAEITLSSLGIPEIWKDQKYKIDLNNIGSLNSYSEWNVNISESTVKSSVSGHYWNSFNIIKKDFDTNLNTELTFSGSIDWTSNLLKNPIITSNNLLVSYKLWWKEIKYYLDDFQTTGLSCDFETLWVKINWSIQWDWKMNITTSSWNNMSDLSKWGLRSNIRKNAYKAVQNMDNNNELGKIKYIEWQNITISWDLSYETLVVKDWNVIISDNLNPLKNKLWIIVLRDNYNVQSDYNNVWNVYIDKKVRNINAIIYADWAVRSAKSNWNAYSDLQLDNSLTLFWSLFTRNTIGWSVKWSTNYTLPWWKSTDIYDIAEQYDLNYVRKVAKTCDWNDINDYSFIINYDSSVQTNPPKLFGQ